MDKNAQRAVIFLDSFPQLEYKYKTAILNEVGDPKNLYACLPKYRDLLIRAVGEEAEEILRLANPQGEAQVLENLKNRGIMPITRGNKYYPENLENTPAPPWVLYAIGNIELLKNRKFAIVGSRKTPQAELKLTEEFAEKIADCMTVVTGVAEGADAAAIRGAMKKNNVISVLAYGFDYVYPELHRGLLEELKQKGLVITEYPPSVPAYKWQFPVRNRIIAGLSEGVLVVSAREKSGALYTASYAATYGRDVFAFPYKVGEVAGKGCNALIKQGAALCDKAEEILLSYGFDTEELPPDLPFTEEEKTVLQLLREDEMVIDVLAERSSLPPYALLAALNSLEMNGYIVKTGADGYRAVK
ncbi:MAG: DNA-protecting protein DprA [Clostridiales bacterium]|nr:DNA-protecting protein DprA [Clostridiales bacterium]